MRWIVYGIDPYKHKYLNRRGLLTSVTNREILLPGYFGILYRYQWEYNKVLL